MTDHPAVKAVLETSSPNGKHARWWTKMFNLQVLNMFYHHGKALLSNLPAPNHGIAEYSIQIAIVTSVNISDSKEINIQNLLYSVFLTDDFSTEQGKDPVLARMIDFLEGGELPEDESDARKIAS